MRIKKLLSIGTAMIFASSAAHAVVIFNDTTGSLSSTSNSTGTVVADPSGAAGTSLLLTDLSAKFSGANTGNIPLPVGSVGGTFTISIDYYVPSTTNLNAGDLVYMQLNLAGAGGNRGSVGFIDPTAVAQDTWLNFTLSALTFPGGDPTNGPLIPAGATDIQASLIIADNGFGAGNDFPGGEALYVDNLRIEVFPIPEPSSVALLGLGALGLLRRRR